MPAINTKNKTAVKKEFPLIQKNNPLVDLVPDKSNQAREMFAGKEKNPSLGFANIFKKFLPTLFIIWIITFCSMLVYESGKQVIFPKITIWQSHFLTIFFTSLVAIIVGYFTLRRIEAAKQLAESELSAKRKVELALLEAYDELEQRVYERTADLNKINHKLKEEILSRKKSEAALKETEERYRLLFKRSPVGIFQYNKNMILTDFNDKFIEILESSREKLSGFNFNNMVDKSILPALLAALEGKEGHYEGIYRASTSDAITYISLRTAPYNNEFNGSSGAMGIVENINERKQAEKALIEAKDHAEKSAQLKSEFLAQMSHEIRTPLNAILSFSGLLKEDIQDKVSPEIRMGFQILENAGKRIIRTIGLILNMAELQAGTYEYNPKQTDLYQDILLPLYLEFSGHAKQKNITLEVIKESEETTLKVDEYSVNQIFNNLIDNAIKYTKAGTVEIKIYNNPHGFLCVDISDTGIGISKQYHKRLFEPFTQEQQGYTRQYEGSGLGLALVKKYCEINEASVELESKKDKGSRFTITFSQKLQLSLFS